MYYRKTKIVCTLGPAANDEETLRQLIEAGMNVARFNFSHGLHDEQKSRLERLKKVREEMGKPVAALLDTKGPEIRLGEFENGGIVLEKGQKFTLTTDESVVGTQDIVSITYKELPSDVKAGNHILIDDGLIDMLVESVDGKEIHCRVENGGKVGNKKGVNVPDVDLSMEFISPKDHDDIVFAVENGYDFIAASFVRTAQDVLDIRKILEEKKGTDIKIISKIENMQGVKNIDEIIEVSDGIMVARGDMGVEIPLEDVPVIQKMIIKKVVAAGKIVITATQMLDSMIRNPRPTRAEATDVANAIYDGTGAVMLSGETANGDYPVEAVKTMAKIAERTEKDINYVERLKKRNSDLQKDDITGAISHATCTLAADLEAQAILTVTKSGRTVYEVSKYRPLAPIMGGCLTKRVYRQLNLCWGVQPVLLQEQEDLDNLFNHVIDEGKSFGMLNTDDTVVMTAGVPLGVSGTTNLVKVQKVD
ncbi:pyruvate kinase [Lachnobacterium bovis]|jgi:pyruvate kinase|uniref:Pyruvate kinase n=1 Tax=Lachnobacterium bovis DSM 14045 TaxID=1122142 RepID=A0A1H3JP69_9FIRM|nr:pyruvate kinase [Lachnobacterium bovis]MBQ1802117.1 pyruvate kinase [Lachnobacterium sp.]SDY41732.1 pyruvate kinase [Lachnobacterium bovis DSM 14045]